MTLDQLPVVLPIEQLLCFSHGGKLNPLMLLEGSDRMSKIAKSIQEGVMAFLRAEYKVLIFFIVAVAVFFIE